MWLHLGSGTHVAVPKHCRPLQFCLDVQNSTNVWWFYTVIRTYFAAGDLLGIDTKYLPSRSRYRTAHVVLLESMPNQLFIESMFLLHFFL